MANRGSPGHDPSPSRCLSWLSPNLHRPTCFAPSMNYDAHEIRRFVSQLFQAHAVGREEAERIAESLVESNLHGHDSHGITLARWYLSQLETGELVAGVPLEIRRDLPGALWADAQLGFGQVQCHRFVELCCRKAETAGAVCGSLDRCGHVGRLGEWVEQAARRGFAALMAVNDNGAVYTVAPPGGLDRCLSTNPIGVGIPTRDQPIVLDMSTSTVANGKLKLARLAGRPVAPGLIQDAEGHPTTDPGVMLADPPGALRSFGGDQAYKGFGLGLVFDILAAGLSGGLCPPGVAGGVEYNNVLLVVWNPELFAGTEHWLQQAEGLTGFIRSSRRQPGAGPMRLPGDRGHALKRQRQVEGLPLDDAMLNPLREIAARVGVAPPAALPG